MKFEFNRYRGIGGVGVLRAFYFQLWLSSCLLERKDFVYCDKEPSRQHSCEVRITLDQGFRRR